MRCALLPGLLVLCASVAVSGSEGDHIVKPGETLNGIANRAAVPRERIIEANGLKPPYMLRAGQALKIPAKQRASATPSPASASAGPGRAPSASGPASYTVKPGETLGGIANREKVPRVLIAEANGLTPPYALRAGQTLMIPRTRRHTVAAGETGVGIASRFGVPWESIAIANGLEPDAALPVGKELLIPTVITPAPQASAPSATPTPSATPATRFAWPLDGTVRRGFSTRGEKSRHDGLDIVAAKGAAVRAAGAGTVIFAGEEARQFGHLVVVDHGGGWHSAYGSLDRVTVKKGDKVSQGERVGLVGDTSVTRRTELHFELRRDGKPVDPLKELPPSR